MAWTGHFYLQKVNAVAAVDKVFIVMYVLSYPGRQIWRVDRGGTVCWVSSQWASYQIRKIAGCACAGNAGNVSPRRQFQRKPLVSDPGMHHGTCVTHVPWCMSGSLTCDDGENVPGIPGACAPAILRIWQEAHGECLSEFIRIVKPGNSWSYEVNRHNVYTLLSMLHQHIEAEAINCRW